MIKFNLIKINNYINNYIKNMNFLKSNEENIIKWGRWCAPHMKNCCENVIDKKVKFALIDNNLDINKIK